LSFLSSDWGEFVGDWIGAEQSSEQSRATNYAHPSREWLSLQFPECNSQEKCKRTGESALPAKLSNKQSVTPKRTGESARLPAKLKQ
jgi:hypothetical protein